MVLYEVEYLYVVGMFVISSFCRSIIRCTHLFAGAPKKILSSLMLVWAFASNSSQTQTQESDYVGVLAKLSLETAALSPVLAEKELVDFRNAEIVNAKLNTIARDFLNNPALRTKVFFKDSGLYVFYSRIESADALESQAISSTTHYEKLRTLYGKDGLMFDLIDFAYNNNKSHNQMRGLAEADDFVSVAESLGNASINLANAYNATIGISNTLMTTFPNSAILKKLGSNSFANEFSTKVCARLSVYRWFELGELGVHSGYDV